MEAEGSTCLAQPTERHPLNHVLPSILPAWKLMLVFSSWGASCDARSITQIEFGSQCLKRLSVSLLIGPLLENPEKPLLNAQPTCVRHILEAWGETFHVQIAFEGEPGQDMEGHAKYVVIVKGCVSKLWQQRHAASLTKLTTET
eukprot:1157525-Pelagomonas_calceolata.AAC.7